MSAEILAKIIDLVKLCKSQSDLFKFSKLHIDDKIRLLKSDPKFYFDKIITDKLSLADKVHILYSINNLKSPYIIDNLILTPDEVKSLNQASYFKLLKVDFKRYIDLERFKNLSKHSQADLFCYEPAWVIANIGKSPKLTSDTLVSISARKPSFIEEYITDFSNLATVEQFWENMFKYNKKYEDIFINNTKSLITKTDVRSVIRARPSLIKKLNLDIICNSKLSCKEWILLCDGVMSQRYNLKFFKDWEFSDDMKEAFKLELTAEILSGKSKLSKRFSSAMSDLLKNNTEDEKNED